MLSFDHQNHSKSHKWCHVRYKGISEIGFGRANIGIKRVGELDFNAFSITCRKRLSEEDIDATCALLFLCSKWEEEIRNPNWHPFQVEMVDGK